MSPKFTLSCLKTTVLLSLKHLAWWHDHAASELRLSLLRTRVGREIFIAFARSDFIPLAHQPALLHSPTTVMDNPQPHIVLIQRRTFLVSKLPVPSNICGVFWCVAYTWYVVTLGLRRLGKTPNLTIKLAAPCNAADIVKNTGVFHGIPLSFEIPHVFPGNLLQRPSRTHCDCLEGFPMLLSSCPTCLAKWSKSSLMFLHRVLHNIEFDRWLLYYLPTPRHNLIFKKILQQVTFNINETLRNFRFPDDILVLNALK